MCHFVVFIFATEGAKNKEEQKEDEEEYVDIAGSKCNLFVTQL